MIGVLSADDLRALADAVDQWNVVLVNDEGELVDDLLVKGITLSAPDSNVTAGKLHFQDGWVGLELKNE